MMDHLNKIEFNAKLLSWRRQFGPFVKCPKCLGLIGKCEICKGSGKVIHEDIDAWNNPFARMKREMKREMKP